MQDIMFGQQQRWLIIDRRTRSAHLLIQGHYNYTAADFWTRLPL